eukprot:CAMPEP_0197515342 /NCGR_PEP_ID=MMETSP1318-20131121/505_1 /TAXON_ID=552666 /ORGANISM="Partenskyella glossopodia, Strain RCC365" /LENGTH=222 /DNA_ID=CAMNT_0043063691 /DNA_START=127 /DNA_END=795 /DNA_ORIENTATION=-
MPTSAEQWEKVLTTKPPNAPTGRSKYASMTVNAAYNLDCIDAVREDFAWLSGFMKDASTLQAIKEGEGGAADFVSDMGFMYQLSQAPDEEMSKYEAMEKEAVAKAVSKYKSLNPLTSQMLGSYFDEGVVEQTSDIADEVEALIRKVLKEVKVEIIAAAPLSDRQKSQILGVVSKYVDKNANIMLSDKVDESLIAGFQLLIEDRFVDLSAKKSLDNLMDTIPK